MTAPLRRPAVVPARRPVCPSDRLPPSSLVTAPTEADREAWARAALSSMHRIGGMPERAPRMPWGLIVGFALLVGAMGLAAQLGAERAEPVRHELRIPR